MPNPNLPPRCDVLMFGRELVIANSQDSRYGRYAPSYRTLEIAKAVACLWHSYPADERNYRVRRIVSSGGFPDWARGFEQPSDDSNEGTFMADDLHRRGVTSEIVIDPFPRHTFDCVSGAVNHGFLGLSDCVRGGIAADKHVYTAEHPLVIAANEAHQPRAYLLTRYAINASRLGMRMLWPYGPEYDVPVYEDEINLTKLTQCAILRAKTEDFPPGSPGCVEHLLNVFIDMWDDREEHLAAFDRTNPNWTIRLPEVLSYDRLPPPSRYQGAA